MMSRLALLVILAAIVASAYALELRYEGGGGTKSKSKPLTPSSSGERERDPKGTSSSNPASQGPKTSSRASSISEGGDKDTDKSDDVDEVDKNDNGKEDNKESPSDEEFEQMAVTKKRPLKIIASSAVEVPNDPVRRSLSKFKGADKTLRAVMHISRSQMERLNKSAETRAIVNDEVRALLNKIQSQNAAQSAASSSSASPVSTSAGKESRRKSKDSADFLLVDEQLRNETGVEGAAATPVITCRWYESQTKSPETQSREPAAGGLSQEGRYVWYSTERGAGAWTAVVNQRRCQKARFKAKQYCRCRRSSKDASSKRGQMDVNVQVVCTETTGTQKRIVPPPATCRTTLRTQISYQGLATVKTDGGTCFPFSPSMDASATNEVLAKINDQDAFVKAGSVQTGNKVTSTITYQLNIRGGVSTTAASGDATIAFGYSEQIQKNYGEKSVDVVGFVTKDITAANNHALSAHLETASRVSITGESYAWASGSAQTVGMGIWYAGISDCPGITEPALGYLVLGTDDARDELDTLANKFLDVYRQMATH